MKNYNTMTFSPKDNPTAREDFLAAVNLLLKNNYNLIVREEDFGILVIEYASADLELGPQPTWIGQEEFIDSYIHAETTNESRRARDLEEIFYRIKEDNDIRVWRDVLGELHWEYKDVENPNEDFVGSLR